MPHGDTTRCRSLIAAAAFAVLAERNRPTTAHPSQADSLERARTWDAVTQAFPPVFVRLVHPWPGKVIDAYQQKNGGTEYMLVVARVPKSCYLYDIEVEAGGLGERPRVQTEMSSCEFGLPVMGRLLQPPNGTMLLGKFRMTLRLVERRCKDANESVVRRVLSKWLV